MRKGYLFSTKLISLVLLSCLLPTSLLGLLAYRFIADQVHQSTSTLVESVAQSSSHQIESWLAEQKSTAEAIAHSTDLLQHWGDRDRYPADSDNHFLALFRLYEVLRLCDESSRWFTEVRLADGATGKVFLSDNTDSLGDEFVPGKGKLNLDEIVSSGRSTYSQVYLAAKPALEHILSDELTLGFPTMWLVAPVRGEGETVGVMSCRIAVSDAGQMFPTEANNVPVDIFLIAKHKNEKQGMLVSTNRSGIDRKSFRQVLPPDDAGNTFPQSGSCMHGYLDYAGRKVVGAWEPVAGTDLIVLIQADQEHFLQPVRMALRSLLSVGLGLGLVFFTLAFLVADRLLKPLRRLTRAAHSLAEGQRSVRVDLRRGDEIGDLGDTFDRMAASLETTMLALEAARDEALAAYRAKSRFLANMTHELRTPLNAIIGFSEMLIGEVGDAGQQQWLEDLQVIRKSGKELLSLINSILDLSKLEAGKMTVDAESFELAELLREIAMMLVPLFREKRNQFVISYDGSDQVCQDRLKVKQILVNLLSNAAKFTENGDIELGAEVTSDNLRIWVRDSGIGMTPEQCKVVFAEFAQADESTTRKYGGTGLGLAIVRRFSELMMGTIEVHSEPGGGTTFTLHLPRTYTAT